MVTSLTESYAVSVVQSDGLCLLGDRIDPQGLLGEGRPGEAWLCGRGWSHGEGTQEAPHWRLQPVNEAEASNDE